MQPLILTVKERIVLLMIIPLQGTLSQIEFYEKLSKTIKITADEEQKLDLKLQKDSSGEYWNWKFEMQSDVTLELNEEDKLHLKNLALLYDQNGLITSQNKPLIIKLLNL
ncbi:hypothetical protein [Aquirufa aurantiipilula]